MTRLPPRVLIVDLAGDRQTPLAVVLGGSGQVRGFERRTAVKTLWWIGRKLNGGSVRCPVEDWTHHERWSGRARGIGNDLSGRPRRRPPGSERRTTISVESAPSEPVSISAAAGVPRPVPQEPGRAGPASFRTGASSGRRGPGRHRRGRRAEPPAPIEEAITRYLGRPRAARMEYSERQVRECIREFTEHGPQMISFVELETRARARWQRLRSEADAARSA